jgi:hypothetical protein
MAATFDRLITYQEGFVELLRPEAVIEPVAIVRISIFSNHARAVCPKMKSTAPTIRDFA